MFQYTAATASTLAAAPSRCPAASLSRASLAAPVFSRCRRQRLECALNIRLLDVQHPTLRLLPRCLCGPPRRRSLNLLHRLL